MGCSPCQNAVAGAASATAVGLPALVFPPAAPEMSRIGNTSRTLRKRPCPGRTTAIYIGGPTGRTGRGQGEERPGAAREPVAGDRSFGVSPPSSVERGRPAAPPVLGRWRSAGEPCLITAGPCAVSWG